MKKVVSLFVLFTVISCITGCTIETELVDESEDKSDKNEYSILIKDSENAKITLTSIDNHYNEICFDVYNKTDETIMASVDLIEIDGKTENPSYGSDILPKTTGQSCTYVSSVKNLSYLTSTIGLYVDGSSIETIETKELQLKKD